MQIQTAKHEAYLKSRMLELSCYVNRVILVSNLIVVYFKRVPVIGKKDIVAKSEKLFSVFMDSECLFKSEDPHMKAWSFIVTGKPVPQMHREAG